MSALILVATPHTAFGELLRISLEESGQYQVRLVQSAKEARSAAGKTAYQLAILDAALTDEPFIPFCFDLLELQSGIRLVVVPPDNNPNHPALGGLIPHGYLNRPFYLPDLIDVVSRLLTDRGKQINGQDDGDEEVASGESVPSGTPVLTLPPWLQEPMTLLSYLETELVNTDALAGMVGLSGSAPGAGSLRAVTGSLNDESAQELSSVIFRYWNSSEKTDLMRFVRLTVDKRDYLVYATQIAGNLVLILVFDNIIPLSQIRPQTKALAQSLLARPPEDYLSGMRTVFAVDQSSSEQPLVDEETQETEQLEPVDRHSELTDQQPKKETVLSIDQEPETAVPTFDSYDQIFEPMDTVPAANEPQTEPLDDSFLLDRLYAGFASEDESPELDTPVFKPVEEIQTPPPDLSGLEEETEDESDIIGTEIFDLSALLGTVPSPDPDTPAKRDLPFAGDWFFERSGAAAIPTLPGGLNGIDHSKEHHNFKASIEQDVESKAPAESTEENDPQAVDSTLPKTAPLDPRVVAPPSASISEDLFDYPIAPSGRPASMEVNTEPPVKPSSLPISFEPRPVDNHIIPSSPSGISIEGETEITPLDDTHPNVVSSINNINQFEPVSPALSLLNYTCVLVPRLPQHYLTGELAEKVSVWVQQLCLAFGWRLEGISIRPEYLQWTVQVAPAISPGNLVRIIRQRTSQHIFSSFPNLATHNPSGDFWAIGYLIVSGVQPPSAQLLRDYIAQTRKRQGINKV